MDLPIVEVVIEDMTLVDGKVSNYRARLSISIKHHKLIWYWSDWECINCD